MTPGMIPPARMRRFGLLLAIVGSASLFRCGGASGRPTLPPPDYEEPPDGLVSGRSAADPAPDAGLDGS